MIPDCCGSSGTQSVAVALPCRLLPPEEIAAWGTRLQQLAPRLSGRIHFLWGTDWEDTPMVNARQARLCMRKPVQCELLDHGWAWQCADSQPSQQACPLLIFLVGLGLSQLCVDADVHSGPVALCTGHAGTWMQRCRRSCAWTGVHNARTQHRHPAAYSASSSGGQAAMGRRQIPTAWQAQAH